MSRCEVCKTREDVEFVVDPFDDEIKGWENLRNLCPDCYADIMADI